MRKTIILLPLIFLMLAAGCKEKPVAGYSSMYEMLSSDDATNEWVVPEDTSITPAVRSVFVKSMKDIKNLSLSPISLMATRKVDGMEYLVLCSKGKSASFKVAHLYVAKDGTCSLISLDDYEP